MSKLDLYVEASTLQNTRQRYRGAIKHIEEEWRGVLPATADSVASYRAEYA